MAFLWMAPGCSFRKACRSPHAGFYENIDSIAFCDGYPTQRQPWVVFSDREQNKISRYWKEDPFAGYQEAGFMEPFIVLRHRKGMCQVAEYKAGSIVNGKRPKAKGLRIRGWIPEERLLLWPHALINAETGFTPKATVVIDDTDVIRQTAKYMEQDSFTLAISPDLIHKARVKLEPGSIVYLYKQSEDRKSMLIGGMPGANADSMNSNIYGWISNNAWRVWGERAALKLAGPDSSGTFIALPATGNDSTPKVTIIDANAAAQRNALDGIFPMGKPANVIPDSGTSIRFFTNTLDYEHNKIYNVLGDRIHFSRYREILKHNRKLNIVFVLDVSRNNRLYLPVVKSLLQELQLGFAAPSYFSQVAFGGVVYKQNDCGISPLRSSLSGNYTHIANFFEDKMEQLQCNDTGITQPVSEALREAAQMLAGVTDETNIIIVLGTTADQQVQTAIRAVTSARARLIFFQTQNKSADAYNDFVLLAQKTVVNSGANIAEIKKEKMVNQDDLLPENDYNLTTGESGVYHLNYPAGSMSQGFVIFPKKGETMSARTLKRSLDSLVAQVTHDNRQIDSTLTAYFRSPIGVNDTRLAANYRKALPWPDEPIPTALASSLLSQETPFLIDGQLFADNRRSDEGMLRGLLLNEQEFEELRSFYRTMGREIKIDPDTRKRKAIRRYVRRLRVANPSGRSFARRRIRNMPASALTLATTGFPARTDSMMNLSLRQWKKSKAISPEQVRSYILACRSLADQLETLKSEPGTRLQHKGQTFYWIDERYFPALRPSR